MDLYEKRVLPRKKRARIYENWEMKNLGECEDLMSNEVKKKSSKLIDGFLIANLVTALRFK